MKKRLPCSFYVMSGPCLQKRHFLENNLHLWDDINQDLQTHLDMKPFYFCCTASLLCIFPSLLSSYFFYQHFSFLSSTPVASPHSLYSTVFLCPPSQMWEPLIPHRNKMKNNEYESVEHVDSDLTLMFENAKRYNVPHSSIYKRALKLQQIQQVSSIVHFSQYCAL